MPLHAKRKIGHPGISFLFFLVIGTRVSRPKNQESPARFRRKLDFIGAILGRAVVVGSDGSCFALSRPPEPEFSPNRPAGCGPKSRVGGQGPGRTSPPRPLPIVL